MSRLDASSSEQINCSVADSLPPHENDGSSLAEALATPRSRVSGISQRMPIVASPRAQRRICRPVYQSAYLASAPAARQVCSWRQTTVRFGEDRPAVQGRTATVDHQAARAQTRWSPPFPVIRKVSIGGHFSPPDLKAIESMIGSSGRLPAVAERPQPAAVPSPSKRPFALAMAWDSGVLARFAALARSLLPPRRLHPGSFDSPLSIDYGYDDCRQITRIPAGT